jgi:hypothetical protein
VSALEAAQQQPEAIEVGKEDQQAAGDVGAFLTALSAVLRETVARLETTVGRMTDIVVNRSGPAERDLVVALQDFDRLNQEFIALGELLERFGVSHGRQPEDSAFDLGFAAISVIPMGDLKSRLIGQLNQVASELREPQGPEEAEF